MHTTWHKLSTNWLLKYGTWIYVFIYIHFFIITGLLVKSMQLLMTHCLYIQNDVPCNRTSFLQLMTKVQWLDKSLRLYLTFITTENLLIANVHLFIQLLMSLFSKQSHENQHEELCCLLEFLLFNKHMIKYSIKSRIYHKSSANEMW